jgi:DNA polymerase/3'-5' exonuclease PolX
MELKQARTIAENWVSWLSPACARMEIAGSIRRQKPDGHDIEICAVPLFNTNNDDPFGNPQLPINILDIVLKGLHTENGFVISKNGPKYKKIDLPEGISIDLFIITPPSEWGVQFVIRTGPADFSKWMVTKKRLGGALPSWAEVSQGAVHNVRGGDLIVPMPEEKDFFEFCGLPYIPPAERQAQWPRT